MRDLVYTTLDSPVGELLVARDDEGLRLLEFQGGSTRVAPGPGWVRSEAGLSDVVAQLRAYFAGRLERFDITVAPHGTAFQQRVWRALLEIPYGETRTYRDIAIRIGRPAATRAVGAANGRNPIAIVIPCHRVIGSDGTLTGYGGGLEIKEQLLSLERARAQPNLWSRPA